MVKGKIDPINGICKFFEAGRPLEWDAPVFPVYEQPEANYHEMSYNPYLGEALAVTENVKIPYETQHEFPAHTSEQYVATGAKVDSEPSMHGEEGWVGQKKVPEWRYDIEEHKPLIHEAIPQVNVPASTVARYGKYTRVNHDYDDICNRFEGKIYDLNDLTHRPVPPSEGLGYTTTHPNCKCYWEPQIDYEPTQKGGVDALAINEQKHITHVKQLIAQRARHKKLHTVFQDGSLSNRTRGTNPMKEMKIIRETLETLHDSFNWMTPEYLARISDVTPRVGGRFMLIRASAETITDHRDDPSAPEPLRRLLSGDEIHAFGRTGIGKGSDINHLGSSYKTEGLVMDAEYDPIKKELQLLHHETDPEIIQSIIDGDISEVSINAGSPRTMTVEICDPNTGEMCVVPRGLILGETDNIAFTYVVSSPVGIMWRGKVIPKATAGVKNTAIQLL